jgi:hypothetical protein
MTFVRIWFDLFSKYKLYFLYTVEAVPANLSKVFLYANRRLTHRRKVME